MNLKKRSKFWVDQGLITKEQQMHILKHEDKRFLPFVLLSFLWIGVFCFCLGVGSFFSLHWHEVPNVLKIITFVLLSVLLFGIGFKAAQKRKKFLLETVLFISFFMIGGGVGIFSQIFNLPITHTTGLLLWAILSFILAFLSKKEFLFLLWIPLFFGGIIGSLRLELLLLFFEQSPLFSTLLVEGCLFLIILLCKNFNNHFVKAGYKWSVVLYFVFLFLALREFSSVIESLIIFLFFTLLLFAVSIMEKRIALFNITCLFFVLRLFYLYFELFENKELTAVLFLTIGGVILLFGISWFYVEKKISGKTSRVLLR